MNKYERWTNCKKSGPLRVRLSTEKNKQKKLLTVRVGLFSLREKAPTKKKARDWETPWETRNCAVPVENRGVRVIRWLGTWILHTHQRTEQKNCENSGGALEMLILDDYSVVIVGLQIYDDAGSARSLYWYFWRLSSKYNVFRLKSRFRTLEACRIAGTP